MKQLRLRAKVLIAGLLGMTAPVIVIGIVAALQSKTNIDDVATILGAATIFLVLASVYLFFFAGRLTRPLIQLVQASKKITEGDLDITVEGENRQDEIGELSRAFHAMAVSLEEARKESEKNDWLKTGIARLHEVMRGDPDVSSLAAKVIAEMARYLDAQVGALYVLDNDKQPVLSLRGSYAYKKRKNLSNVFKLGEGLVGQAALEKQQILIRNVPEDYFKVTSGLGECVPRFVCVTPFLYEGRLKGVVELGTLSEMTDRQLEYLDQTMRSLAFAVESAENRGRLQSSEREAMLRVNYLQGLNETVMAIDNDFTVMFINTAGLDRLGLKETAIVGRKCYELWKTQDCHTERCACARAMREGTTAVARTIARAKLTSDRRLSSGADRPSSRFWRRLNGSSSGSAGIFMTAFRAAWPVSS